MRIVFLAIMVIYSIFGEEQLDVEISAQVGVRSAPVNEKGAFRIDNVPLDVNGRFQPMGQQYRRVRFYARIGESLVRGNSDIFKLNGQDDEGNFAPTIVESIDYSSFKELPSKLTMSLDQSVLYTHDSVQLSVFAHYNDHSFENLLMEGSGLSLAVSDPAALIIQSDGTITAGPTVDDITTVAIIAYFDGLITSKNIKIVPSTDLDGDGMSDGWEQLYGFNYNDASDKDGDPDADGLTNYEEYLIGSNPLIADTDNDGLLDGIDPEPLIPESIAPSVNISLPTNDSDIIRGDVLTIAGSASDNVGVKSVRIVVDGVSLGLAVYNPMNGTFGLVAPVTSPVNDDALLVAVATDIAGNTAVDSIAINITEDTGNKAPIVDAGEDVSVIYQQGEAKYVFRATVADELIIGSGEGMPPSYQDDIFGIPTPIDGQLQVQWTSNSDGYQFITDSDSVSAVANMYDLGNYEFILTVDDGEFIGSDSVNVSVFESGAVNMERVSLNNGEEISNGVRGYNMYAYAGQLSAFLSNKYQELSPGLSGVKSDFDDDVYVYDRVSRQTELVTKSHDGLSYSNGYSFSPNLSDNGEMVSFISTATNLIEGDSNPGTTMIYRRNLNTAVTERLYPKDGFVPNNRLRNLVTSSDGRYLCFVTNATNFDTGVPGETRNDDKLYRYDTQLDEIQLVTVTHLGESAVRYYGSNVSMSDDGRFIVFDASCDDLVEGIENGPGHVYIRDMENGHTKLVSKAINGDLSGGGGASGFINRSGTHVVFDSYSDDLDANDTDFLGDVFVYDVSTEVLRLVYKTPDQFWSPSQGEAAISDDGNVVVCNYELSFEHGGRTRYVSTESQLFYDVSLAEYSEHRKALFLKDSHESAILTQFNHVSEDTNYYPDIYYHQFPGLNLVDAGPDDDLFVFGPDENGGFDYQLQGASNGSPIRWEKVFGPGVVEFSDEASVDSVARFYRTGTYILQISTQDGEHIDQVVLRFTTGFSSQLDELNGGDE